MSDKKFGDPIFGSTLAELKAYAPCIATADGLRIEGPNHKVAAMFAAAGCLGDLVEAVDKLTSQRDALLAALEQARAFIGEQKVRTETVGQQVYLREDTRKVMRVMCTMDAAIAAAKGGA